MDSDALKARIKNIDERTTRIEQILPTLATKHDLKAFATKDDLKAFATKDDLRAYPTREEVRAIVRRTGSSRSSSSMRLRNASRSV